MVRLDADGLCEEALRRRPHTSFHDPAVVEGLRVLCDAVRGGAILHRPGRRLLQAELLRILDQRLAAEQSGIFDVERSPPWSRLVVVTGLPRTASTFFHSTVAGARGVVAPTLSQLLYPMHVDARTGEMPSWALERVQIEVLLAQRLSPTLRDAHPMAAASPE
jgi:hypothetical protein